MRYRGPWKKAVDAAGLEHLPWLCFHSLRHTYAYNYLRAGGGVRELQAILGHSSLTTTELYLRRVAGDLMTAGMLAVNYGIGDEEKLDECPAECPVSTGT